MQIEKFYLIYNHCAIKYWQLEIANCKFVYGGKRWLWRETWAPCHTSGKRWLVYSDTLFWNNCLKSIENNLVYERKATKLTIFACHCLPLKYMLYVTQISFGKFQPSNAILNKCEHIFSHSFLYRIRELNNLEPLENLQRLYLGMNRIQVSWHIVSQLIFKAIASCDCFCCKS